MSQILCLDIGNTNIYGGVLSQEGDILFRFRKNSTGAVSADEYGIFLRSVLKENGFNPLEISEIVLCSVVPDITYSLTRACQKYFTLEPFTLQSGVRTGLKILYKNPLELGADRIANAVAGIKLFSQKNLIIVDMGTATTFEAVTAKSEYLGGAIIPGLRISMEALGQKTARLPLVEIKKTDFACGRSTIESIQSGLYWEHLGAIKELIFQISRECFNGEKAYVIATGGFSHLFAQSGVFDHIDADLVLKGMFFALQMNGHLNN